MSVDLYRWIDQLRAAGLNAREQLVALWVRASLRMVALRLARQTPYPNSLAVAMLESWLLDGMSSESAMVRVSFGLMLSPLF